MKEILPSQAPGNGEREQRSQHRIGEPKAEAADDDDKQRPGDALNEIPARLGVQFLCLLSHPFQCHCRWLRWLVLPDCSWVVPGGIIPHGRLLRETAAPGCS